MKKILMALALTGLVWTGAQAREGCKTKAPTHKYVATRVVHKQKTATAACRLLPYEVCTINPDRQSVSCYKTIDPDANVPLYKERISYGATGRMPGQVEKPKMKTIVIKGESKGDFCQRDEANSATVCYHEGGRLTRDEDGFYHYEY